MKEIKQFEFNAYITIDAENYEQAIDLFEFQLKYGIDKYNNCYVAEIKELEGVSEWTIGLYSP